MVSEWTSNDVPSVSSLYLYNRRPDLDLDGKRFGAAAALEAVVAHLNDHHPKPDGGASVRMGTAANNMLRETLANVERDRERQLARAQKAERERDEAQERVDQLRDERDDAVQSCITVGRARDEWQARAEAAEARTAPAALREEWAARYTNGGGSVCRTRDEAEAELDRMIRDSHRPRIDEPPAPEIAGIYVRHVTDWEQA